MAIILHQLFFIVLEHFFPGKICPIVINAAKKRYEIKISGAFYIYRIFLSYILYKMIHNEL